jgi:hypothetical protein
MATLAIPEFGMRVQAETPGPPAREPAETPGFGPVTQKSGRIGKERYTGNVTFRRAPDSNLESGFLFFWRYSTWLFKTNSADGSPT